MSPQASTSFVKSIGHLPTAILMKLNGSDKTAPLFVAPRSEDEDFEHIVELPCGHIICENNDNEPRGAPFGLSRNNSFLANLSIFDATRCPTCESSLLAKKAVSSGRDSASRTAEEHTLSDEEQELYGLERWSTADEQEGWDDCENARLLAPAADGHPDTSIGRALRGACRRAKEALSGKGVAGSGAGFGGAYGFKL